MRAVAALVIVTALALAVLSVRPRRRIVQLPAGTVELHEEISADSATEVRGAPSGTVLHLAAGFTGRAAIVVHGSGVYLRDFTIDGNREALEVRAGLPPSDRSFATFTRANGVLAEGVHGLTVERVGFRAMAGFAVLVSASHGVIIDRVQVEDGGSRTAAGRNNATGGILLEEGTTNFQVTRCYLHRIRGNGVWTHSLYTSPRNSQGLFAWNRFDTIGRDAIQVGHATGVRVLQNAGARIGFLVEDVNMDDVAVPVAIDTAGNVEACTYEGNRFVEIDGKCLDLDGFHDGEIRANVCINRQPPEAYRWGNDGIVMNNSNPDMTSRNIRMEENTIDGALFGGIFVIGTGHRIVHNRLLHLNMAHCNDDAARFGCYYAPGEPDMLRTGIYLGRGAHRPSPATGNLIEDNQITGYQMDRRCIGVAPGVSFDSNTIRGNSCREK